jgi:hypothetical protein
MKRFISIFGLGLFVAASFAGGAFAAGPVPNHGGLSVEQTGACTGSGDKSCAPDESGDPCADALCGSNVVGPATGDLQFVRSLIPVAPPPPVNGLVLGQAPVVDAVLTSRAASPALAPFQPTKLVR